MIRETGSTSSHVPFALTRVPERRYSDEEVRLILSSAVEVDSPVPAAQERGLMGLGGLGMAALGALQLSSWSSTRKKQFDAVTEYARSLSAREKNRAS